jgi:hypothetical protein
MWYKKPKILATIIVAAVLLVVSIVGVIIGVTRHKEGEFLEVCWTDEGVAQYKENYEDLENQEQKIACNGFAEYQFEKSEIPVPITLFDCEDTPQPLKDEAQIRDIQLAVKNFNREVGFELVKLATVHSGDANSGGKAFIGCALQGNSESTNRIPAGRVQHYKSNGRIRFFVWIRSDIATSSILLYKIFLHELGHSFFLEHDGFPSSRMYWKISERLSVSTPRQVFLTDVDRRGLRERYHSEK